MLLLKTCTCGCAMHIYKHGSGPYVNLTPDTAKYIKYGIAGNHAENCLLFNSELRSDFDTPEDAAATWNNFINKD